MSIALKRKMILAIVLVAGLPLIGWPACGDEPKVVEAPAFERAEPGKSGIDVDALERLRKRAAEADSDAVVVVKDGRLIADWDFGQPRGPIEAMSATKSIVSLAIGRLIEMGKIKSLDQPIYEFYPEWKQGRKQQITIRQLLNHTSGLQAEPMTMEIYASPDFVQLALAAELSSDPGTKFFYNNKAVNLLAGVVLRVSGTRMDRFIAAEIFQPLDIKNFGWTLDKAGNPHGMAGLQIRAIDLAKIGQMMLEGGSWKGKHIISNHWIQQSIVPGQKLSLDSGLLWWVLYDTTRVAIDDAFIKNLMDRGMTAQSREKLEKLRDKMFERDEVWVTIGPLVRADAVLRTKLREIDANPPPLKSMSSDTPAYGYEAQGYLGQYLVVLPGQRLVAVRQRRYRPGANSEDGSKLFTDFRKMVKALVSQGPAQP